MQVLYLLIIQMVRRHQVAPKDFLTSTDWTTFNNKQNDHISLTTTGSSGASTFNSGTGALNIPNYLALLQDLVGWIDGVM
jgi:hypothetical protein